MAALGDPEVERPCIKWKKVPTKIIDPITGKKITVLKDICVQRG